MAFDPMTGEEIPEVNETVETTETTEAAEAANEAPAGGFDPMTGEPIGATDKEPTGFDPMTGEPIYETAQEPTGFDPMTGEPIYGDAAGAAAVKAGFPLAAKIAIGVAAGVVLVGGVGYAVVSNLGGVNGKVAKAIANTCKGGALITTLSEAMNGMDGDTASVTMAGEIEDVEFEIASSIDMKGKEFSTNGYVSAEDVKVAYEVYMDDKEVQATLPDWIDYTYVYNYVEDKDGYLIDMMDEEGFSSDDIDELLQSVFQSTSDSKEIQKRLVECTWENIEALEFEKTDAKEFKYNDKKQKCKGYQTVITEDILSDWLDSYEEVYDTYFEEVDADFGYYGNIDVEALFNELEDEIEDMDDIEMIFYLYKDIVAAVEFEGDDLEGTLEIRGGAYPTENCVLNYEDRYSEYEVEISGSTKGGKEEQSIEMDGEEVFAFTYDTKSGDLEISFNDGYYTYGEFEGNLKADSKSLTLVVDSFEFGGSDLDVDFTLTLNGKADIHKISATKNDLFDLGNADEDDWEDMMEDIEEQIDEIEDAL